MSYVHVTVALDVKRDKIQGKGSMLKRKKKLLF